MKVRVLSIDCEKNDAVDIRCGGPAYLGFDFYVKGEEDKEKLRVFLEKTLKKHNRPNLGMNISPPTTMDKRKLWSRKMIDDCIQKGY